MSSVANPVSSSLSSGSISTRAGLHLLAVSFASLYFELLFIRWLPSAIHILGYFTNLVLIASYLGLGIGVARPSTNPRAALRALLAVVGLGVLTLVLHAADLDAVPPNETYYINEDALFAPNRFQLPLYPTLVVVFLTVLGVFYVVGQLLGQLLRPLPTLPGYSINILGSLLGSLAFTAVSALSTPPWVWLAVGMLGLTVLVPRVWMALLSALLLCSGAWGVERWEEARQGTTITWSPYYAMKVFPLANPEHGSLVHVNNNFLLSAITLEPPKEETAFLATNRAYYALPHRLKQAQDVLVLGAGAGNDVHAALLAGARSVTAVEIDPRVAAAGRDIHPRRPYRDERVRLVVDDARSFLRHDANLYDVIIFGTLDSHTLFSSMSSVRLENFVYTVDCFRDAAARLKPDGILVVAVGGMAPWVHMRIVRNVEAATGGEAVVYYFGQNIGIVAGGGARAVEQIPGWRVVPREERTALLEQHPEANIPATDDWPHIFVRAPGLPWEYTVVLGAILLISMLLVRRALPTGGVLPEFFLLGTAFLLMETKGISELGLVFGATWVVSAVVISVILLAILLGNWASERRRFPRRYTYPLLIAALVISYAVPITALVTTSWAMRLVVAAVLVGIPVVLSSLVFADAYRDLTDVGPAFGSNLLGAVLGGVLEYSSMAFGLKSLCLVAAATYLAAMLLRGKGAASR
ncbi:MAG: hypothetical protein AB2A00_25000 [Myxococcota bacterium]